jgi:hypothetical protein
VGQATAPATIAAPATPAHWACALDAKRGVSRHLWEQHGSAGKRAPAATSSEHHVKGTCTCSAQRTAHSAQHARARMHAGTDWFSHAARVLVWPSVQCVHVRSFAERRECQLVWPCPPALEARRRPPPATQASSAKSWARQLPECHENWRSAVRLELIGTCLTTRLTSYRNLALLWLA